MAATSLSPTLIISAFVTIVIGASLVSPLADIIAGVGGNVTGAALAIYSLMTLIFVIIVIITAVKVMGK